jgi:hypothetical protein
VENFSRHGVLGLEFSFFVCLIFPGNLMTFPGKGLKIMPFL